MLPPRDLSVLLFQMIETGDGAAAYYGDVMQAAVSLALAAPCGPPSNATDFLERFCGNVATNPLGGARYAAWVGRGDVGQLRMLHWNIHSWRDASGAPNRAAVAAVIRRTAPDVVSLVEVQESWGIPGRLAGLSVARLSMGVRTGAGVQRGASDRGLRQRPADDAADHRRPAVGDSLAGPVRRHRTVRAADGGLRRVRVGGALVWVISTHLPASNEDDRQRALSRFASLLQKLDGPWLACGDFNTAASTWAGEVPDATFCPDPHRPTFPARWPRRPIDYCLASAGVEAKAAAAGLRVGSPGGPGHRPYPAPGR